MLEGAQGSFVTPLMQAFDNLWIKLELFNRAGSHKARAASHIIAAAIRKGDLVPGGSRRIIEKSGGNFGVGLAYEARKYDIAVDLVIGLSFSPLKRALCEEYGAQLVGIDLLKSGLQPKEVIARFLAEYPDRYFFTDQFSNEANIMAHLEVTGPQLLAQLGKLPEAYKGCIFVTAAGTGASATGIGRCLKAALPNVSIVLNEPERCSYRTGCFGNHIQQGTAVGVFPPFLDMSLIDKIEPVADAEAREGQRILAADTGIYPGPSSGANYFLARRLAQAHPDYLVTTLIYDGGEGYLDASRLTETVTHA